MVNTQRVQKFANRSEESTEYFKLTLYGLQIPLVCFGMYKMWKTQGFKNVTLFLLLLTIMILAVLEVTATLLEMFANEDFLHFLPLFSYLINADDMLVHWIITQNYIKTAFETKQVLNPETYIIKGRENPALKQFQSRMKILHVFVVLLIMGIAACYYFAW